MSRRVPGLARHLTPLFPPAPGAVQGRLGPGEKARAITVGYGVWIASFVLLRGLAFRAGDGSYVAPALATVAAVAAWAAARIVQAHQGADPGARSVLIVEDDDATRNMLVRFFHKAGWDVRTATTRDSALGQLADRPDWVILDLMLPDGSGYEVLRRIRGSYLPVQVAVVTGAGDGPTRAAAHEYRPDLEMTKPIAIDALMRIMEGTTP